MTWRTIFSFIGSATLLTLLSGWLIRINVLPIQFEIAYSTAEKNFVQIWILIAIAIGLLLPCAAFLIRKNPQTRVILGFYLLVLAVQIVTEQISSRIFPPSLAVIIGSLYTAFRLWQLWQGRRILRVAQPDRAIQSLLWLLLLFWSANLIFLLITAWPKILLL